MLDRFMEKVSPEPNSGCWLWTASASRNQSGFAYGHIRCDGKLEKAHRVAYRLFRGPIPAGTEIDHLCRVTLCVNPSHLEAVPHRENVLRGRGPTAVNAQKTHCDQGHELSGKNLLTTRSGGRVCIVCSREASKLHARRERSENREAYNAYRRDRYHRLKSQGINPRSVANKR